MTEYIIDFGDTSSAFVGLAMAEARVHGAELHEEIVRCRECRECVHIAKDGMLCWLFAGCEWGERKNDD